MNYPQGFSGGAMPSMGGSSGRGSKFFTTSKKGEIYELKAQLNSDRRDKKRDAIKKVIANMTVGKDVSALFPDVVNCMQTDNLELKKLVYLYLMNYAKSHPDLTIMAVNTFQKDCHDPSPLIRALAVRTMGCVRVDKITEYLCDPLRKCLRDEDPYVRKTAAVCVAKLYDINPDLVVEQGFIETLRDLLSDANPMVVANAVAALSEINEVSEEDVMLVNSGTLNKLLTALNECTEWGQIFILDSLATIEPKDSREAQSICERVMPRLQHANTAVVLSAVKVLLKYMEYIEDKDFVKNMERKLAPPLVTMLSAEPEVQYVALRNINLIVQRRPNILKHEIKIFFVKYNDPTYVKMEKLDVMIKLATEANISQVLPAMKDMNAGINAVLLPKVLAEMKEYATEVDVDFVRRSVRAIGRCAIKIDSAAERCIDTLVELIQTKVNYVVQEAIVVIKDIFRKYPNRYESIIGRLCENLDTLDEPEAKSAMIWILGEYCMRIDNADEILEQFLENFLDEGHQVQLQILTAIVKLFLQKPQGTQELVQKTLSLATQDSDNPDLRDRGYIYWRLLSTDPAAAKAVVLADKPLISEETETLEPALLDELICNIGTLASIFHKPPSTFSDNRVPGSRLPPPRSPPSGRREDYDEDEDDVYSRSPSPSRGGRGSGTGGAKAQQPVNDLMNDLLGLDLSAPASGSAPMPAAVPMGGNLMDLLGGLDTGSQSSLGNTNSATMDGTGAGGFDLLGGDLLGGIGGLAASMTATGPTTMYTPPKETWLPAAKGKGLEIKGTFTRRGGQTYMDMTFTNKAMQPMSDFAIQFNKNSFGVVPAQPLNIQGPLMPNTSRDVSLPLSFTGVVQGSDKPFSLQVAVKNSIDVMYFACDIVAHSLFVEGGAQLDQNGFDQAWDTLGRDNERRFELHVDMSQSEVSNKLSANNMPVVFVQGRAVCAVGRFTNGTDVLIEVHCEDGLDVTVKSQNSAALDGVCDSLDGVLHN